MRRFIEFLRRWFDPHHGARNSILARWIFLRALALIYFSAFYSLLFQIKGLIGPQGILAGGALSARGGAVFRRNALLACAHAVLVLVELHGHDDGDLDRDCRIGDRLPERVAAAQLLSSALSAFSRSSLRRRIFPAINLTACCLRLDSLRCSLRRAACGRDLRQPMPPSRASLWLLRWEWFRIYFESGLVKLLSGDPQWRNLTAMDEYYQNSPLPTWIGWYVQHLPHWFHATSVVLTLGMELVLVWMLFFPRRVRLICFFIVTPWEIVVILTGNYAFLNYIVLALGFLSAG